MEDLEIPTKKYLLAATLIAAFAVPASAVSYYLIFNKVTNFYYYYCVMFNKVTNKCSRAKVGRGSV